MKLTLISDDSPPRYAVALTKRDQVNQDVFIVVFFQHEPTLPTQHRKKTIHGQDIRGGGRQGASGVGSPVREMQQQHKRDHKGMPRKIALYHDAVWR